MVSVVDGGSNLGCVKPKAIKLLVAASMVSTQHSVARENTCFVTVNGHKYSSPSILRYIFHIKPHFTIFFYCEVISKWILIIFAPEKAEIFKVKDYLFILA